MALVVLAALAAIAPAVAAVETSADAPDSVEVGTEVSATFEFTKLYEDGVDEWTLAGSTKLDGASWTVEKHTLGGDVVSESFAGSTFQTTISASENVERVEVTIRGTVPPIGEGEYRYDPPQAFTLAAFRKVVGDSETLIHRERVHHYTAESMDAREAIDAAAVTIEAAGGNEEAEAMLQNAISAFEAGNFPNAIDLANQAESRATQATRASQRTQLLLYAGIGVLALVAVFGGVTYLRSKRDTYDKLG